MPFVSRGTLTTCYDSKSAATGTNSDDKRRKQECAHGCEIQFSLSIRVPCVCVRVCSSTEMFANDRLSVGDGCGLTHPNGMWFICLTVAATEKGVQQNNSAQARDDHEATGHKTGCCCWCWVGMFEWLLDVLVDIFIAPSPYRVRSDRGCNAETHRWGRILIRLIMTDKGGLREPFSTRKEKAALEQHGVL